MRADLRCERRLRVEFAEAAVEPDDAVVRTVEHDAIGQRLNRALDRGEMIARPKRPRQTLEQAANHPVPAGFLAVM